jgi:hypothetical protein
MADENRVRAFAPKLDGCGERIEASRKQQDATIPRHGAIAELLQEYRPAG